MARMARMAEGVLATAYSLTATRLAVAAMAAPKNASGSHDSAGVAMAPSGRRKSQPYIVKLMHTIERPFYLIGGREFPRGNG
jgi:hypothetical protein